MTVLDRLTKVNILPLLPKRLRPYAKSVLALVGNLLAVSQFYFADNSTLALMVVLATALGVYAQPNEQALDVSVNGDDDKLIDLEIGNPLD